MTKLLTNFHVHTFTGKVAEHPGGCFITSLRDTEVGFDKRFPIV